MQVQNIQSPNFEAKKRYVTPEMRQNIVFLVDKMSDKTTYSTNGYWFRSTIFKEISTKNSRIRFQDGRIYLGDKFNKKVLEGQSLLTIGKTELVIDIKTGEIIDYYKPLFSTWKNIIKKIGKSLEFFKENFNNEELVNKKSLSMQGFTEKGLEKFNELKKGVNG